MRKITTRRNSQVANLVEMTKPTESSIQPIPGHKPRRVVLIGFMGAGKTTVGELAAKHLGWSFFDADNRIEALAGKPIHAIFATEGEAAFRQLEFEAIQSLLSEPEAVIAVGGGAIEHEATRRLLLAAAGIENSETLVVHLHVSLQSTIARCEGTGGLRPVFADRVGLAVRYERRMPWYAQAHLTLETESTTPEEVARQLAAHLQP
jgi:shikimate kinase